MADIVVALIAIACFVAALFGRAEGIPLGLIFLVILVAF